MPNITGFKENDLRDNDGKLMEWDEVFLFFPLSPPPPFFFFSLRVVVVDTFVYMLTLCAVLYYIQKNN